MPPINSGPLVPNVIDGSQPDMQTQSALPVAPQVSKSEHHYKLYILVGLLILMAGSFIIFNNKGLIPISMKDIPRHCSSYLNICVNDPTGKWKTSVNALHDFDLSNESEGILLAIAHSTGIEFKGTDAGFVSVSLLGQNTTVYKDTTKDLTRVITGINDAKLGTLIVLISSANDITAEKVTEIVNAINIPKR